MLTPHESQGWPLSRGSGNNPVQRSKMVARWRPASSSWRRPDLLDLLAFLVGAGRPRCYSGDEPKRGSSRPLEREDPSVAIVDINMGPWGCFRAHRRLRRRNTKLPILVLTGRQAVDDKVRRSYGADDYVCGSRSAIVSRRAHRGTRRHAELDRDTPESAVSSRWLRLDLRERLLSADGDRSGSPAPKFPLSSPHAQTANPSSRPRRWLAPCGVTATRPTREVIRVALHRLRRKLVTTDRGQIYRDERASAEIARAKKRAETDPSVYANVARVGLAVTHL